MLTVRRSQDELINDLLKIMEREDSLTLKYIAEGANMSFETARVPFRAIDQSKLALLTGLTPIDQAKITSRGLQFLKTFRLLKSLMRYGFKP